MVNGLIKFYFCLDNSSVVAQPPQGLGRIMESLTGNIDKNENSGQESRQEDMWSRGHSVIHVLVDGIDKEMIIPNNEILKIYNNNIDLF